MVTAGDGWAHYESGGDGENSHKRPFQPERCEEPQRFSKEAGQNNSTVVSDEGGSSASISSATKRKSEHEQMWNLKNFTRSEVNHPTTIENLPSELLSNIFIRLLAKQLGQMRSVSKFWNALLSESSFIKSHLHRSIHNNNRVLLVFYDSLYYYPDFKPSTTHPSRPQHRDLTDFIKPPPVNPKSGDPPSMIKVIGSIHGLICSSYDDNDVIHIWNPSLSAVLTVPPHSNSMPSGGRSISSFGFGYDPKTDDYKIVKLTGLTGTSPLVVKQWLQVEVYSMRNGSWKSITQRIPSHVTWISHHDLLCVDGHDGHLHWTGYIGEERKLQTIVAFDLGSETFREMSFPDSIQGSRQINVIGVWDGKPCVFPVVVTDGVCEVWMMEEYGVPESWVKHAFSKFVGHEVLLGFTSTNEFLLLNAFSRLVLYNPTEQKAKTLENFCHDGYGVEKVVEYVDSLVWIAPIERAMVDDAGQS